MSRAAASPFAANAARRILLVEADATLANIIARELTRRYEVVMAKTTNEALAALKTQRFDVLVSAQHVGDDSAMNLFKALSQRWPHVRRVLYTDAAARRVSAGTLAHAIVDTSESFQRLLDSVELAVRR
jgi:ActR/RegA family two-component response regulator